MKLSSVFYVLCVAFVFSSCGSSKSISTSQTTFDKQSHRGGRGLMPENTIAAMKMAIDYGTTLELDLQMSKDKKIVVSHDPFFNSDFGLTPEGKEMKKQDGRSRMLFNMTYDSIRKYDVGLKPHPLFPRQQKIAAHKPLLSALIDSAEAYAAKKKHINHYNIEIKSRTYLDGIAYPSVDEFVDAAMKIVNDKGIGSRTMMQSFDVRALRLLHERYPNQKTSFLVLKNNKNDVEGYLSELGFKPAVFSPEHSLVTKELVDGFHQIGVLVIPWTVNDLKELQRLKDLGVDGIITDYPDLFSQLK